jgi:hypothetical protein
MHKDIVMYGYCGRILLTYFTLSKYIKCSFSRVMYLNKTCLTTNYLLFCVSLDSRCLEMWYWSALKDSISARWTCFFWKLSWTIYMAQMSIFHFVSFYFIWFSWQLFCSFLVYLVFIATVLYMLIGFVETGQKSSSLLPISSNLFVSFW